MGQQSLHVLVAMDVVAIPMIELVSMAALGGFLDIFNSAFSMF